MKKEKAAPLTVEMLQHHVWHCLLAVERNLLDNKPVQAHMDVKNAQGWFNRYWKENPS